MLPPDLRNKRSIIVTRVDDVIYKDHEPTDIGEQLEEHNEWMQDSIENIFKFPNSSTLKITFTKATIAKKCLESGFLAYNLYVSPYDIKQETFIPVKCCMRCYQLEGHNTRDCPKHREYKICSECGLEGHIWHQCLEEEKCCINCQGPHSTMAMRCPLRKEIIKAKREEENERNKQTYTGALMTNMQQPSHQQQFQPSVPMITKEELLKIHICITHAKMKEADHPGTYELELNRVLKANNLPSIIIPKDDDAGPSVTTSTTSATTTATALLTSSKSASSTTQAVREKSSLERHQASGGLRQAQAKQKEVVVQQTPQIPASAFGMNFYTTIDKGWPETKFTNEDLYNGINKGIYKWTSSDTNYTEEQLLTAIKENRIILTQCWNMVEKDIFRKIRSGIQVERTPPQDRDPRNRRTSARD